MADAETTRPSADLGTMTLQSGRLESWATVLPAPNGWYRARMEPPSGGLMPDTRLDEIVVFRESIIGFVVRPRFGEGENPVLLAPEVRPFLLYEADESLADVLYIAPTGAWLTSWGETYATDDRHAKIRWLGQQRASA